MKIEYSENPLKPEDRKQIDEGFLQYDKDKDVNQDFHRFSFLIRDDNGKLVGALIGYIIYKEVCIDELWIDKEHRGKGYGKELLNKLEEKFKDRGLNSMSLYTSAFQAPGFYEKYGFEPEFIRKNKDNPKLDKYFFVKRF